MLKSSTLLLASAALAFANADNATADTEMLLSRRNVQTGTPDLPPYTDFISPLVLPAPNVSADGDWADAVNKARAYVEDLTLLELVNITTGQGLYGRCIGLTGEITRKNFSGICLEDSPTGVRHADLVSAFPAGINAAATWDKDIMLRRGKAMGAEFRGKGVNVALSPMMNLGRAAAAGRNWEGAGGDPFLVAVTAVETIKGIQSNGVSACAKHFIGNEQEHFRGGSGSQTASSNINDRTIHELYMWPFAESVRAGVTHVMASYNRINQTHATENSKVINGLLKEELEFHGVALSDWGAITQGVSSVLAGMDMNMPGFTAYGVVDDQANPSTSNSSYWGAELVTMVNNGTVPMSRLKDMVTRTFAAYYKMGQDQDYPKPNYNQLTFDTYYQGQLANEHIDVQADHYKIIREIGAASVIMLKNVNQTLPLNASVNARWGLFGSDAGAIPFGPNGGADRTTSLNGGTLAVGWGSGTTQYPYLISPQQAIERELFAAKPNAGVETILEDYNGPAIDALANAVDQCIVFANSASGEGYITVDGNAGDRNNISLWHDGANLITQVAGNCSNTVVVLHTVGEVDLEPFFDHPNVSAILHAGLPGQESGNSLVDVLFGRVNPSGRLPYTIAKNLTDYPAQVLYTDQSLEVPQINYSEELLLDYRWFDAKNITPRAEFGFGMSYTNFSYASLSIKSTDLKKRNNGGTSTSALSLYDDAYTVTFDVKNSGGVDGHEVSQVYLGFPESAGEPPKVLRGFERTYLKVGESQTVSIKINKKGMSIWDVVKQAWTVPLGEYQIYVGASSRDLRLQGSFTIDA